MDGEEPRPSSENTFLRASRVISQRVWPDSGTISCNERLVSTTNSTISGGPEPIDMVPQFRPPSESAPARSGAWFVPSAMSATDIGSRGPSVLASATDCGFKAVRPHASESTAPRQGRNRGQSTRTPQCTAIIVRMCEGSRPERASSRQSDLEIAGDRRLAIHNGLGCKHRP